ncbi:DNA-3-methyladenine glycosylase I [Thalassotalea piscium]|uniref:DNA-3-methyladenine glycosylase I n=1 Tax=Thalassotalea piscium TaxID=1230533 RepID=A0A7X0NF53_9GAMM|nr:DNA-3-methyladenine glycosylase I [Thalassotalea piscium]MBB6542319.1 DNA-3-methyladenine glycosylase I [Thalassotalea piscium]
MNDNKLIRCSWLDIKKADYVKYHDNEWGIPTHDDKVLFENLILESAQAGLSWYTILKRRKGYRKAFYNFDIETVAQFDQTKIDALMLNSEIIRNRLKITSTVNNAKQFIVVQSEFGSFSNYLWQFVGNKTLVSNIDDSTAAPTTSVISDILSKDLKKRGFKFVGSTICYAYLQACGLINGHSISCYRRKQIIDQFKQQ